MICQQRTPCNLKINSDGILVVRFANIIMLCNVLRPKLFSYTNRSILTVPHTAKRIGRWPSKCARLIMSASSLEGSSTITANQQLRVNERANYLCLTYQFIYNTFVRVVRHGSRSNGAINKRVRWLKICG